MTAVCNWVVEQNQHNVFESIAEWLSHTTDCSLHVCVGGCYTQEVVQDISSQKREMHWPSNDVKNACMSSLYICLDRSGFNLSQCCIGHLKNSLWNSFQIKSTDMHWLPCDRWEGLSVSFFVAFSLSGANKPPRLLDLAPAEAQMETWENKHFAHFLSEDCYSF